MSEVVLGIDLGTTNSEVAAFEEGRVRVLGSRGQQILPSCVGFSPTGELLVGQPARNQYRLHPERTVRSIKRRMGSSETVRMGTRDFTPQEISALILRELASRAARQLGTPVSRAVLTVPAWFSDAQRNATREAGALAGLEVVRILNEPTAASLAYGFGAKQGQTALVYDLGGGTFDVSVVRVEEEITEVLASHGNNRLGGDDFDELIFQRLAEAFKKRHGTDLGNAGAAAEARLRWAAEEAKRTLSSEPYATVREESLAAAGRKALHLEVELAREDYEAWIRPLLEGTLESVSRALEDARLSPGDLDTVLLVGGSTRTPLVSRLLRDKTRLEPRQDVDPDLCVALGAGVLASRLGGREVEKVLVDVSPFSFGPSHLDLLDGVPYPYCYKPIIRRNTPLPVSRTERYFTVSPRQTEVQLEIFQGDHVDALRNAKVGEFLVEGLRPMEEPNEVLCRMTLDLDGILHVTAVEKATGLSKQVVIEGALRERDASELEATRLALEELYAGRSREREVDDELILALAGEEDRPGSAPVAPARPSGAVASAGSAPVPPARPSGAVAPEGSAPVPPARPSGAVAPEGGDLRARALVERSQALFDRMHPEDVEEAEVLHGRIREAVESGDRAGVEAAARDLEELLFFVETP